jgi:uncharacterized repeat protein (TIGR03803 family)
MKIQGGFAMRTGRLSLGLSLVWAMIAVIVTLPVTSIFTSAQETILYNFSGGSDGSTALSTLISDASGNLYGTTEWGGAFSFGTVFELSPQAGGGWTETVLHSFNNSPTEGANPWAGLIFDAAGNLYGTTRAGGTHSYGNVFELSPQAGGGWTITELHQFNATSTDGRNPTCSLIMDTAGNLYGTTTQGGAYGKGTAFELLPQAGGGYKEKVLHSFGNGLDGQVPVAGMIFDGLGNLYGTTAAGGAHGGGTVFELLPQSGGGWKEMRLANFSTTGSNPYTPNAPVVFDTAGNLYSTTYYGGFNSGGTAFELSPKTGGGWTAKVIHNFGGANDGFNPESGLTLDSAGNLYGTTEAGYSSTGRSNGAVYELSPKTGGGWTETVLYSFSNTGTDAGVPYGGVILDAAGNLYGTTSSGGTFIHGAVFEIAH